MNHAEQLRTYADKKYNKDEVEHRGIIAAASHIEALEREVLRTRRVFRDTMNITVNALTEIERGRGAAGEYKDRALYAAEFRKHLEFIWIDIEGEMLQVEPWPAREN